MKPSDSHIKYAKALLSFATRQGVDELVLKQLSELSALYAEEGFSVLVKQFTFMKPEKGQKILSDLFSKTIEKCLLNLLIILMQNRKLLLLPRINKVYRKLYHGAKGIADITLITARELPDDEKSALAKALATKKGKEVSVSYETNPSLIGGVQYYEEGYLTDLSVKNYLQVIKNHLISNEIN